MSSSGKSPGRRLSRLFRRATDDGPGDSANAAPDNPTADAGAVRDGRVEEFSAKLAAGWVAVGVGAPSVEVVLRVNGHPVAKTAAGVPAEQSVPGADVRGFRFALADLWSYVGPDDRITVTAGDAAAELEIAGHGGALVPTEMGGKSTEALFSALASGSLFSRFGRLQKSRTVATGWQKRVTYAADSVQELIKTHFDYDVFYAYGSMLGAVREGGFLGHDDDLDLGYVSRHRDGDAVGRELADIAMMLIDNGLSVEPFGPLCHVYQVDETGRRGQRVDMFQHFFDASGLLRTPWGMAGTVHLHIDQWAGVVEIPFGDRTVPVPSAAEAFLAQLYGDRWREPQPGFSWRLDMTENTQLGRMPPELGNEVYWADFYRRVSFTEPSDFCTSLLARPDCPTVVLDLGCGDGRDSIAFAETGRTVNALDSSPAAVLRVESKQVGLAAGLLRAARCDISDPVELTPHILSAAATGQPVLYYLRFPHDLSPEQDTALLAILARQLRQGDMFATEFRGVADEKRRKARASPRRNFRDGDRFAHRLASECGLAIEASDHGAGRSVYGREDPDLHRIVARR